MDSIQPIFIRPCDTCRRRKVKCDKVLPTCLRCHKSKTSCSYEYVPKKRGPAKSENTKPRKQEFSKNSLNTKDSFGYCQAFKEYNFLLSYSTILKLTSKGLINDSTLDTHKLYTTHAKENNQEKSSINDYELLPDQNLIQKLMSNLTIGDSRRLYLSMSGKINYLGDSPMGFLLTMYMVNHPNKGSLLSVVNSMDLSVKDLSPGSSKPSTTIFHHITELNIIVKKCIHLYFEFFHPYCPVVNKKKLLSNPFQISPLLLNLVCAIGTNYCPETSAKYLGFFSEKIAYYFKGFYYKCNLETVTALILMTHFQHDPDEFEKGWVYLGYAQRMIVALGVDKEPPRSLDLEEAELRRRLWHWCFILDRLYSFSINRLSGHDCKSNSPNYPTNFTFELRTEERKELIQARCSIIFTRLFSEICYIMSVISKNFDFTQEIEVDKLDSLEKVARAMSKSLDLWDKQVDQRFYRVVKDCSPAEVVIVSNFSLGLKLIYHGTLIQLYQIFCNVNNEKIANYYEQKCSEASDYAIDIAWKLGINFNFHLITYKLYVLSCSIMVQVKKAKSVDPHISRRAKCYLKKGLIILTRAQSVYKLSTEFLSSFFLLAKAERIEVDEF